MGTCVLCVNDFSGAESTLLKYSGFENEINAQCPEGVNQSSFKHFCFAIPPEADSECV